MADPAFELAPDVQAHGDTEVMVRPLLADYDVDEAKVRRDLATLVGQLEGAGLIRRR